MQEVKIYVGSSIKGPCIKPGAWAAVLECQTEKGPAVMGIKGKEESATCNRLTLLAIIKAMERLNRPCKVTIYTDCIFVKNMIEQGRPEEWKRAEWKKPSGEEIKNRELWQEYRELSKNHKIAVRFCKYGVYAEKIGEMLAE